MQHEMPLTAPNIADAAAAAGIISQEDADLYKRTGKPVGSPRVRSNSYPDGSDLDEAAARFRRRDPATLEYLERALGHEFLGLSDMFKKVGA